MSVIASNSVNFVPVYQILKNYPEIKVKEVSDSEKIPIEQDFDSAELSKPVQSLQTNPVTNLRPQSEEIQTQGNPEFLSNTESVCSFILDAKDKAMAQQANQSKQNVMVLI